MASSSTNQGVAATTIDALNSDIIESHILTKFDGPSLASLASTSNLLHSLCSEESLWKHICDSTWNSVKHPLVQRTISSFPGGYRSFYSDSFPVLRASSGQGTLQAKRTFLTNSFPTNGASGCHEVDSTELISAVDLRYRNDIVYSKVKVTDTNASSFAGSLFYIDLIEHKENVEIPIRYEGDENILMSKLQDNLTLSWIVIDPILKRAANVSSLKPVSVQPNADKTGVEVTYAINLSGACCGIDTAESVECRLVAKFCCEKGNSIELRELSLCLVDMVRSRLNGEMSLRILKEAMENGERRKENGQGKEYYAKNLDYRRQRFVFWVFLAISLISLLWFA